MSVLSPPTGISEGRALVLARAALSVIAAVDILKNLGSMEDGATVPAHSVRWFCEKIRDDAMMCLEMSDSCAPEPDAAHLAADMGKASKTAALPA